MNLKDFNTAQEIVTCKNPMFSHWIIAIDIGFSSVKAMAPNKRYCFPSYVRKIDGNLVSVDDDDIYYRDKDGMFIIGTKAQDLVRSDDTNDTDSAFARNRYYSKEFIILARTAVAIGLMGSNLDGNDENGNQQKVRPYIQTGLPAAYVKEDSAKIKSAFTKTGSYYVKVGNGPWMHFDNDINSNEISVISQPTGTLNSLVFDDDGNPRPESKKMMEKNIIIADIGFGTFDPYGLINRKKSLEESINNLGMKRVLETASKYIFKEHNTDIRIPQMRKCIKDGYFKIVDVENMISKKVNIDTYIEKACEVVAKEAVKKTSELAGYFQDYDIIVVTGGTGAAWFDVFKESLSGFDDLEVIPGNFGNSLPIYYANARGYYMFAYRKLISKKEKPNG